MSNNYTMLETHKSEKENKRKGKIISFVVHALLLLILFLYTFPTKTTTEVYPPPVTVEFDFRESSLSKYARAEEGKMRDKNESPKVVRKQEKQTKIETKPTEVKVKKPDLTRPNPVITPKPKPSVPIVTDATMDDAPIEVSTDDIDIEVTDQEILTEEDLAELEEEAEIPVEEPTGGGEVSEDSSESGGSSQSPSSLEGDGGTGKGKKGTGAGASSGDDGDEGEGDAGSGTGMYDGSGRGIFGRKVIKQNWRGLFDGTNQSTGKIVMKLCINPSGDVVYTEINDLETTETNPSKLKQALKAMRGYKFEPDPSAPSEQCGKYSFTLEINALK